MRTHVDEWTGPVLVPTLPATPEYLNAEAVARMAAGRLVNERLEAAQRREAHARARAACAVLLAVQAQWRLTEAADRLVSAGESLRSAATERPASVVKLVRGA